MKFKTYFEVITSKDKQRHQTVVGSRFRKTYEASLDENGVLGLIEKGVEDIYETIQADKMLTDIDFIVKKFTLGDTSVLERVNGVFGDFSDVPSSYFEALDKINKANESFESLPVDIKKAFNNSPTEFLAAVGSQRFFDAFAPYLTQSDNAPKASETVDERSDQNE